MLNENVIEVEGLTKYYGDFLAVDHLTFSIKKGETFGFLGPNGAGKTTTIRMLTGISKPSEGTANILGYDLLKHSLEIKRRIGVAPEESNLYDDLTAIDNLIFMAQLYGVPRKERVKRAEELLKMFNLYEKRNTLFRKLSKGMKRITTVAAALVHRPEIVFLDEPTAGLDVVAARGLRSLLRRLRDLGVTIFLTTHYLEEADTLCDRIAIIVKGRIVRIGTPEELKRVVSKGTVVEFIFKNGNEELLRKFEKEIEGVKIAIMNGNSIRAYGEETGDICKKVLGMAENLGLKVESVKSITPTLEDAFLELTGLSPVVMAMEKEGRKKVEG
jgi:ABC-2 type transport system ATP-binding protein